MRVKSNQELLSVFALHFCNLGESRELRTREDIRLPLFSRKYFSLLEAHLQHSLGFAPSESQIFAYALKIARPWLNRCVDQVEEQKLELLSFRFPSRAVQRRYIHIQVDRESKILLKQVASKLNFHVILVAFFVIAVVADSIPNAGDIKRARTRTRHTNKPASAAH